jgi:type III secretion system FlhB-like substrate exporter
MVGYFAIYHYYYTAKYHFLAWKRLADELNFKFDKNDNELLKGVSRIRSFEIILEINGAENKYTSEEKDELANRKNEYYKEFVEQITKEDILEGVPLLIEKAKENDVPLYKDNQLADTLSRLKIGDAIPPELYQVVAEILVFVDDMDRLKAKMDGKAK